MQTRGSAYPLTDGFIGAFTDAVTDAFMADRVRFERTGRCRSHGLASRRHGPLDQRSIEVSGYEFRRRQIVASGFHRRAIYITRSPLFVWSVLQVSNLRPHAPKASALPTAPSTVEIFHPNDGVPWKFRNSDLSVIDRVLCL